MKYIKSFKKINLNQTINRFKEDNHPIAHRFLNFLIITVFTLCSTNYSMASNINSSINNDKDIINNTSNAKDSLHNKPNSLSNNVISKDDIVIGSKDAKVIFIEYFSPTCAHCSDHHLKTFPKLKEKYIDTDKIAYVMRESVSNKQDLDASLIARCSGDMDSYLKLSEYLLLTQETWAYSKNYRAKLFKIANRYGISEEQYNICLNDESKSQILFDYARLAVSDKDFIGTPSFYINGKLYEGEYSLDGLSNAIESELTKVQQAYKLKSKDDANQYIAVLDSFKLLKNKISTTAESIQEFMNMIGINQHEVEMRIIDSIAVSYTTENSGKIIKSVHTSKESIKQAKSEFTKTVLIKYKKEV